MSSIPWVSQFSWYFIIILIWGQGVTIFKELSVAVALSAGSPILIAFQLFLNPCQLRAGILCKNTSIVSIEVFGHNILENDLSAHVFTLTILSHHFRNWKLRYIIPSAGPLSRMEYFVAYRKVNFAWPKQLFFRLIIVDGISLQQTVFSVWCTAEVIMMRRFTLAPSCLVHFLFLPRTIF